MVAIKKLALIGLTLLFPSLLLAESEQTQVIGPFGTLNTTDSPAILGANQAQDMLNVDISPGGKSVRKREGFALDTTFTTSTGPVHGAYKFFDSSGNEVRLVGQDDGLRASVSGAAWVRVSSGTAGATWQCTDYLGFAYCVNSARDTPVKTAGTVATTSFQGSIPAGTMIASTPERLLVAGVSGQLQRLYYSGASNFTDFTLGSSPSSSSYEDITAPGSQLTHISYQYGRWLWWKDQSFGFIAGTDQTNLQIVTVSYNIGTFDNTEVYDSGLTWFRGTDAHFYTYDGTQLSRKSRDISPTVTSANRRKANSWTQSSQLDFQSGSINLNGPTQSLSTTISAGSLLPSSITITDTNGSDFNQGVVPVTIDTTTVPGAVTLKTFFSDTFASLSNWTNYGSASLPGTFTLYSGKAGCNSTTCGGYTNQTVNNDYVVQADLNSDASGVMRFAVLNSSNQGYGIKWTGTSGGIILCETSDFSDINNCVTLCTGANITASPSTIVLTRNSATNALTFYSGSVSSCTATDSTYTSFSRIGNSQSETPGIGYLDNVYDTARTGNFTSRVFDTAFSTPVYGPFTANSSGTGTFAYAVRTSSNSGNSYNSDSTITSGSAITSARNIDRYLIYSATLTATTSATSLPQITDVSVVAASTGTFYSAVYNPANFTSWSAFTSNDDTSTGGSIAYFMRAGGTLFSVNSSTPGWIAQGKNATVAASTGTYFQVRADFTITNATQTPTISDFTVNWYEGNAADKMYGTYFNYATWFAVSLGTTTTTNNRILRYDYLNDGWNIYDIASNGFLTYNNRLYFGDSSAGKTYVFGGVSGDNNAAINSYWKSKDFFGFTPFIDEDLRTSSWYCKLSSGTTLSVTYQINESTQTTYTINLYDSRSNIIRHNRNFAAGSMYNVINWKFGDNSNNTAWEVFAGQYTYMPRPWNVYP